MKINKEWHQGSPMPKNPSLADRVNWHIEHANACKCRQIPSSILKEIRKKKIKV